MVRLRKKWSALDFYLDGESVTKTELAKTLGISKSTLLIWENCLFFHLESYRQSSLKKSDGTYDRTAPYNAYQCWVLARFGNLISTSKTIERAKVYLQTNQHVFSVSVFKKNLKNLEGEK